MAYEYSAETEDELVAGQAQVEKAITNMKIVMSEHNKQAQASANIRRRDHTTKEINIELTKPEGKTCPRCGGNIEVVDWGNGHAHKYCIECGDQYV